MILRSETLFPTTRFTLLAKLNDSTARAWDEFFSVYGPVIYRMARHAQLSEDAAEEIVAVVMRNFAGTVASGFIFDPKRGQFRRYLRTLTNRSIQLYRRGQNDGATGRVDISLDTVADEGDAPDAEWEQTEREERWQACLERLRNSSAISPRDLEVFELNVLARQPADSVARRLGIKVGRVHGIKHELIRRLRQIREELDAELGEV